MPLPIQESGILVHGDNQLASPDAVRTNPNRRTSLAEAETVLALRHVDTVILFAVWGLAASLVLFAAELCRRKLPLLPLSARVHAMCDPFVTRAHVRC